MLDWKSSLALNKTHEAKLIQRYPFCPTFPVLVINKVCVTSHDFASTWRGARMRAGCLRTSRGKRATGGPNNGKSFPRSFARLFLVGNPTFVYFVSNFNVKLFVSQQCVATLGPTSCHASKCPWKCPRRRVARLSHGVYIFKCRSKVRRWGRYTATVRKRRPFLARLYWVCIQGRGRTASARIPVKRILRLSIDSTCNSREASYLIRWQELKIIRRVGDNVSFGGCIAGRACVTKSWKERTLMRARTTLVTPEKYLWVKHVWYRWKPDYQECWPHWCDRNSFTNVRNRLTR